MEDDIRDGFRLIRQLVIQNFIVSLSIMEIIPVTLENSEKLELLKNNLKRILKEI